MLDVKIEGDAIRIGERFVLAFQRTLRIPDDGRTYPLPPGLGAFPLFKIADYAARVPAAWRDQGGVFLAMYQREAMWLSFLAEHWKPSAVQVAVGRVNAISGEPHGGALHAEPQDYAVCPQQPWLDGIKTGPDTIRQFVAMPLGLGYTVEAAVTGEERFGGIQITVYEPKPGKFPDQPPAPDMGFGGLGGIMPSAMPDIMLGAMTGVEMGLGAGGTMRQKVYPDPYGIETWDADNHGAVVVHIVNSLQFREITGKEPPPTPVDAKSYTKQGLPWFDLYDEAAGDVPAAEGLAHAKTVAQRDKERQEFPADAAPVDIPQEQVVWLDSGAHQAQGSATPDKDADVPAS